MELPKKTSQIFILFHLEDFPILSKFLGLRTKQQAAKKQLGMKPLAATSNCGDNRQQKNYKKLLGMKPVATTRDCGDNKQKQKVNNWE